MIPEYSQISRVSACVLTVCALAACGSGVDDGYGGGTPMSPPAAPSAPSLVVRTATLSGAQEVPAVTTAASGRGAVVVDPSTRAMSGAITFTGLTGAATGAHIHKAAPGIEGGVEIGLLLQGADAAIVPPDTVLTEAQYNSLLAGELYFNVHTAANGDGEIRGQIMGQGGNIAALAILDAAQEVQAPAVVSSATGKGTLVVDSATREIIAAVVTFGGIGTTVTGAHIHQAATGTNGSVIVGLNLGTGTATASHGAVLSQAQYDALLAGNLYFNVHSSAYSDGEIRGQIAVQTQGAAGIVPTLASIQSNVFTPSCALSGCHGGAAAQLGLRLDSGFSAASLINVPSAQNGSLTRVLPGDPNTSLLIQKLENATPPVGVRMPFGGPYLPQSTVNVIRQWIQVGAPTT